MKPRKTKNPHVLCVGKYRGIKGEQEQFRTLACRWFLWLGLHQNSQRWGDLGDVIGVWCGWVFWFGWLIKGVLSVCLLHARLCGQSLSVLPSWTLCLGRGWLVPQKCDDRGVAASFPARPRDFKSQSQSKFLTHQPLAVWVWANYLIFLRL